MLTPSLKLKRRTVLKKYGEAVEELYREAEKSGERAA
jgi:long-chain acyl-CoA synthetase